jgi:PLP dependent protein
MNDTIADRLAGVRHRIETASRLASRDPASVTLIAVAKTHPAEAVAAAIAAGQCVFGENRVQEAADKYPNLRATHRDLELHLIGPLQSNKAADAVRLFDVIHGVDREKLGQALRAAIDKQGRRPRLLVQVNTGEEAQKSGVMPDEADALIDALRTRCGLVIDGLMCIPPADDEPALHFALLREIARRNGLALLSMGMSGDFECAIRFGATHLRIGSAIFGERPPG